MTGANELEGLWTPEQIAKRKADPRSNDPKNWVANPQLDAEDEAILAEVDRMAVADAQRKKLQQEAVEEVTKQVTGKTPKQRAREERFISDMDDGGIEITKRV